MIQGRYHFWLSTMIIVFFILKIDHVFGISRFAQNLSLILSLIGFFHYSNYSFDISYAIIQDYADVSNRLELIEKKYSDKSLSDSHEPNIVLFPDSRLFTQSKKDLSVLSSTNRSILSRVLNNEIVFNDDTIVVIACGEDKRLTYVGNDTCAEFRQEIDKFDIENFVNLGRQNLYWKYFYAG